MPVDRLPHGPAIVSRCLPFVTGSSQAGRAHVPLCGHIVSCTGHSRVLALAARVPLLGGPFLSLLGRGMRVKQPLGGGHPALYHHLLSEGLRTVST